MIIPHVSGLALITAHADEAVANLQALLTHYPEVYDLDYGFKDSVNAKNGKVSYRFSALAQEWMFLSLVNYLADGFIWRYFYMNEGTQRAHEEAYGDDVAPPRIKRMKKPCSSCGRNRVADEMYEICHKYL